MSETHEAINDEDVKVEIKFKKRGNKNLRRKIKEDSEDDEDEVRFVKISFVSIKYLIFSYF